MNITRFIASRILKGDGEKKTSRPIVRIATGGIAVGVILMILAHAGLRGFQQEIRNKVIGFGSHFQVVSSTDDLSKESTKITFDTTVYESLKKVEGVTHVHVFASKPGIIETKEGIQGVVIKGVGDDYDWSFLKSSLVEGQLLQKDSGDTQGIIVSSYIAQRLKIQVGQTVSLYFVNNDTDARQLNFKVNGIYETGVEDFDEKLVFLRINHVQRMSGWGIQAQIYSDTVCNNGAISLVGFGFGGSGEYDFDWGNPNWDDEGPYFIRPGKDTTLQLILADETMAGLDTARVTINYIDDQSTEPCRPYTLSYYTSGGSEKNFIGGYEVLISDYDQLSSMDDALYKHIPFYLKIVRITDRHPEIFAWLKMLDLNVIIIFFLMIGISIVNMTSALLIIILERQNMIGTLKAFGMRDHVILRVFLINAGYIICKGLLIGNAIGLGLALIQKWTGIIRLDPSQYYVDRMPIQLDFVELGLINGLTIGVCMIFLILPALYVTTITPIKAIRFD